MKYEIKHVHLELSSLCNARCPYCARNAQGYPYNFGYKETNLSLEDVKKIFSPEFINNLNEVLINGNYGDFVMNPESVEIIDYFLDHNPGMKILVNTNGSARDADFWQRLGEMGIDIMFCVDGLEDTNHLYRQDTDFKTIMRNMQRFIGSGGNAIWKMTKFDFNLHQIEDAKKLAHDMGVQRFVVRDTNRDRGPVYNRKGQKIHFIKEDDNTWPEQITDEFLKEGSLRYSSNPVAQKPSVGKISCIAEKDRSIYVSADGHVSPCCWTGFSPSTYRPVNGYNSSNRNLEEYIDHNHAPTHGLTKSLEWFDKLFSAIESDNQPHICQYFCKDKS